MDNTTFNKFADRFFELVLDYCYAPLDMVENYKWPTGASKTTIKLAQTAKFYLNAWRCLICDNDLDPENNTEEYFITNLKIIAQRKGEEYQVGQDRLSSFDDDARWSNELWHELFPNAVHGFSPDMICIAQMSKNGFCADEMYEGHDKRITVERLKEKFGDPIIYCCLLAAKICDQTGKEF